MVLKLNDKARHVIPAPAVGPCWELMVERKNVCGAPIISGDAAMAVMVGGLQVQLLYPKGAGFEEDQARLVAALEENVRRALPWWRRIFTRRNNARAQ